MPDTDTGSAGMLTERPVSGPPVRCSFCGWALDRWYYGGRTPLCARCRDQHGPVLHPARWRMDPRRVSGLAWRIWQRYHASAVVPS